MKQANLGLIFFPAFDWMISPGHPERQERLLYTRDQLTEEGLFDRPEIREYRLRMAEINDLQRAHVGVPSIAKLITPAHLASAGGCMTAADAVMSGEVKRAFALVRPPGHHAMRIVHGIRGFCTINIEAVMVEYLRSRYGIKKIAVVDTDVHHGDGSQDIFYHDPNVLYISFHQDGRTLYPGTGFPDEAGSPAAWGYNINLPLLPGSGDKEIHRLFDGLIKPILDDFEPELIINSAGQDNHFSDPLASMSVTAHGYAALADKLKADIAVLEGGYSIEAALPYVNTGIILAMNVPVGMPIGQLIIGDLVAIIVVKQLFGGIGMNFANPALVGRIVLFISFAGSMNQWVFPDAAVDQLSKATPLAVADPSKLSLLDLFMGIHGGVLGETCALAIVLGLIYLVATKTISIAIPSSYVGSVFVFYLIATKDLHSALVAVLSGGLLFGAVFMATDYVTSPFTLKGKLVYGVCLGIVTFAIRYWGSYTEGVSFALLFMNLWVPYINDLTRQTPYGYVKPAKKEAAGK